jgi:predicted Zn-dependent protease
VAAEPAVRIGQHLLYKFSPSEAQKSVSYFEQAVARSPQSADARAGLSLGLLQLTLLGVRQPAESLPSATQYAKEALAADPDSAAANLAMGMIHLHGEWKFGAAEERFRRALESEPDSGPVRLSYARLKLATGQLNEAERLIDEALRLDPASPSLGVEYCRLFYFRRDFHRAEAECRKVLYREPGYALAHYYLALSLGMLGRFEDAETALRQSGLMPGVVEADLAWLRLRAGDRRPALAALAARRELIRRGKIDATAKLLLAAALDERDEAFEAIDTGIATHASEMLTVHIDPRLDPIRNDPRYAQALRRLAAP